MQPTTQPVPASRTSLWAGRILSTLVLLLVGFTAMFGVLKPDVARQGFAHYGYPDGALLRITIIEIACAVLYAIPRNVRVGEPFSLPVTVGIVLWLGLYLRDHRVGALVPFRSEKMPLTNS